MHSVKSQALDKLRFSGSVMIGVEESILMMETIVDILGFMIRESSGPKRFFMIIDVPRVLFPLMIILISCP